MYMYIAIIYRTYNSYDVIEYRNIDEADEDMKLWEDILWAYVYERLTGKMVRHLTNAMHSDGEGRGDIWTNEDESAEIERQIMEDARRR